MKPAEYGQKVAKSVVEQITPQWNAMQAKAQELEVAKKRITELEKVARQAQQQAKVERERANKLDDLAELFSPEEIAEARARKAARDKADAQRKVLEAKEARKRERIEALPGLEHKTAGADRTFVTHALAAIRQAGGDASKVEWSKVEGAAAIEALSKNGQSIKSVTRAICELSPIRGSKEGNAKVAEWVKSVAPKYQKAYREERGRNKGQER